MNFNKRLIGLKLTQRVAPSNCIRNLNILPSVIEIVNLQTKLKLRGSILHFKKIISLEGKFC